MSAHAGADESSSPEGLVAKERKDNLWDARAQGSSSCPGTPVVHDARRLAEERQVRNVFTHQVHCLRETR
jgi:hypothetical protein